MNIACGFSNRVNEVRYLCVKLIVSNLHVLVCVLVIFNIIIMVFLKQPNSLAKDLSGSFAVLAKIQ